MPRGPQRVNPHEEAARRRKAYDFATHLESKGVSAIDLSNMHPDEIAQHAKDAKLKTPPSAETLEQVHSHLAYKARLKANPLSTDAIFNQL